MAHSPSPSTVRHERRLDPPLAGRDNDIESGGDQLENGNGSRQPSIFSIEPCSGYQDHQSQRPKLVIGRIHQNSTEPSLEAIVAIVAMGSTIMVGLMAVNLHPTKGDDDAHRPPQTAFFDRHPMFSCSFVVVGVATFYFIAIGAIICRRQPTIARTLNLAALVLAVLAVTMLLWTFLPKMFRWVPWIFFAITIVAALVVQAYEWCKPMSGRQSCNEISWARHDDGYRLPTIYTPSVILRKSSHQILMTSPFCSPRLRRAHSASL